MPEIHVVASITTAAVKDILRDRWGLPNVDRTRVVIDAVDHTRLHDDYAEICSFLSDQARVVTELQALNTAIRNKLEAADASGEVQGVRAKVEAVIGRTGGYDDPTRAVAQGEPARVFKTHKVLSGVLDEAEQAGRLQRGPGQTPHHCSDRRRRKQSLRVQLSSPRGDGSLTYRPILLWAICPR